MDDEHDTLLFQTDVLRVSYDDEIGHFLVWKRVTRDGRDLGWIVIDDLSTKGALQLANSLLVGVMGAVKA